ncbi:Cytochrome c-555 [uncultured Comamonas sp.]|nr:Cytochrome c-555 [uncultured Comamonas sp.]
MDGKSVYGKTCAMCHAAGVAGAPKPGDKEAWAPRIAQGNDTMYKHALEGFTGDHGMMPARGGSSKLTDEEVKAAVDFMVSQSV